MELAEEASPAQLLAMLATMPVAPPVFVCGCRAPSVGRRCSAADTNALRASAVWPIAASAAALHEVAPADVARQRSGPGELDETPGSLFGRRPSASSKRLSASSSSGAAKQEERQRLLIRAAFGDRHGLVRGGDRRVSLSARLRQHGSFVRDRCRQDRSRARSAGSETRLRPRSVRLAQNRRGCDKHCARMSSDWLTTISSPSARARV